MLARSRIRATMPAAPKDLRRPLGTSVDAEGGLRSSTRLARIAGRFSRVEPRRQAWAFLLELLSDVDTRSCWQLAGQAGGHLAACDAAAVG